MKTVRSIIQEEAKQNKCAVTSGEMGRIGWIDTACHKSSVSSAFSKNFSRYKYVGAMLDINVVIGIIRGHVEFYMNTHGAQKRVSLPYTEPWKSITSVEHADRVARKLMDSFPVWWKKDIKRIVNCANAIVMVDGSIDCPTCGDNLVFYASVVRHAEGQVIETDCECKICNKKWNGPIIRHDEFNPAAEAENE